MSTTLEHDDDTSPKGPWIKVAIAVVVVAAALFVMFFFSGKWDFFAHKRKNEPQAASVVMPTGIPPLQRPLPQPVAYRSLPPPEPPAHKALQQGPAVDTERQKALDSPLDGYVIKSNATSTTPVARKQPDSPDDLPTAPDALEASLQPTKLDGTRVAELPDPRWLVEQGRVLPCTQQTRINSALPGLVTAILAEDVRGETGDVVLLGKGSRIFGTVQHALVNGLDRLAVLWQNITTPVMYGRDGMPHQYRIAVNSPAASEVGEAGLDGEVNRHLWKKIGGIIGISLIEGAVQAGVSYAGRSNGNGTTINLDSFASGGNQAADKLLSSWVDIPDILTRDQGLKCSVYVARDLDMKGAYMLTRAGAP